MGCVEEIVRAGSWDGGVVVLSAVGNEKVNVVVVENIGSWVVATVGGLVGE